VENLIEMDEIQTLLLSTLPLWITEDAYRQLMVAAFPLNGTVVSFEQKKAEQAMSIPEIREYLKAHTYYQYETHEALLAISAKVSQRDETKSVQLTDEYNSPSLDDGTIAYHRVFGVVTANSYWYFSSKQLEQDIIAAESNPQISAHLLHINSPGGEAWYMDRLSETLRSAKKPIIAIYEEYCASAAYYIGCHGQKLYATTNHDFVGCIGTMCSFWNFEPYFEKLGLKKIVAKATNSSRKNKIFEDLKDGKSEDYIKNVLDPMNEQFLAEVKSQRSELAELDDDAPVLQGESLYTAPAEEVGLIDGKRTLLEAIAEVAELGEAYMGTQSLYGFS
jgi:ClpP class serine protease